MQLNKPVQVIDKDHEYFDSHGVLIRKDGNKCIVRFSAPGGMYKYGDRESKKIEYPEFELDIKQLKQEDKDEN